MQINSKQRAQLAKELTGFIPPQFAALLTNHSQIPLPESADGDIILPDGSIADASEFNSYRELYAMRRSKILKQFVIKEMKTGNCKGDFYTIINGHKMQCHTRKALEDKIIDFILSDHYMTFCDAYHAYWEQRISRVKDPRKLPSAKNTELRSKKDYKRYIEGTPFEQKQLSDLTDQDVTDLIDFNIHKYDIHKQGLKNLKTLLSQVLQYGLVNRVLDENPMDRVDWSAFAYSVSPSASIDQRVYTEEEVAKMYEYARQKEAESPQCMGAWAYELILLTGCRRGEIPPLTWSDVHLEEGYIDIHQEMVASNHTVTILPRTKTDRDRYFPIVPQIADFLTRLKCVHDQYFPDSDYLFPGKVKGLGCITLTTAYAQHNKACKALGIRNDSSFMRGTHSFRRIHQTSMMEQGANERLASQLYGNSPQSMKSHYLLSENALSAAEMIEATDQRISNAGSSSRNQADIIDNRISDQGQKIINFQTIKRSKPAPVKRLNGIE